jgi:hypothetical protein
LNFRAVVEWTNLGHSPRAGEDPPVLVSALVLLGAVGFTLVAAYQWAGRLGIFGEATTLAPGNWQGRVWQGHVWNTVLAIILWLIWFYG